MEEAGWEGFLSFGWIEYNPISIITTYGGMREIQYITFSDYEFEKLYHGMIRCIIEEYSDGSLMDQMKRVSLIVCMISATILKRGKL